MAKKRKEFTKLEILNVLRYLEQCGSVIETAQKYDISRTIVYKWKKVYADDYEATKNDIQEHSLTVEAQKMIMKSGTAKLTQQTLNLYDNIISYFSEDFEQKFINLDGKEQIALLNTILPYVLEKKGVIPPKGPGEGEQNNTQNNFFLNIIKQLKDGDSEDEIHRNIKTITGTQHPGRES